VSTQLQLNISITSKQKDSQVPTKTAALQKATSSAVFDRLPAITSSGLTNTSLDAHALS
jgi:hypothetical protein